MTKARGNGWRVYEIEGQVWLELTNDPHYWSVTSHKAAIVLTPDVIEGIKNIKVETGKGQE